MTMKFTFLQVLKVFLSHIDFSSTFCEDTANTEIKYMNFQYIWLYAKP